MTSGLAIGSFKGLKCGVNSPCCQTFRISASVDLTILPCRTDNFAYLLTSGSEAFLIDAPESAPILSWMRSQGKTLKKIVNTHGHHDHVDGNPGLLEQFDCAVLAPAGLKVPGQSGDCAGGQTIELAGLPLQVLETPGHTLHDISLYQAEHGLCFCGDTVFVGGCGRLFEGTPAQLWNSICTIRALPDDTRIYCGHDYASDNFQFACREFPFITAAADRLEAISGNRVLMPTTVAEEKESNPMWMADDPQMKAFLNMPDADAAEVFARIRGLRDRF